MTIGTSADVSYGVLGPPVVDTGIIDLDVHPATSPGDLDPYLPKKWRDHIREFGVRAGVGTRTLGGHYPPFTGGMREDAWPKGGGRPGSDLQLMREQLLDMYNVQLGTLECLDLVQDVQNPELAAVLCRAVNDWQLEHWVYPEPRLRMAMTVPIGSPDLAVKEIERVGDDPGTISVMLVSRLLHPIGHRAYWPLLEAAQERGLPLQMHLSVQGPFPSTGVGWPGYYMEIGAAFSQSFQAHMLSVILSGVLEDFPGLKFVFVEGGALHYLSLLDRLDYHWETLRHEVPRVTRKPSEYLHDHFWFSTQPMEEPPEVRFLTDMLGERGFDNICFSTDYPHWDFDSPTSSLPSLPPDLKNKLLRGNAMRLFGLDGGAR
jgi:predicted TIM-barrel fold metal-dependent hydrolase